MTCQLTRWISKFMKNYRLSYRPYPYRQYLERFRLLQVSSLPDTWSVRHDVSSQLPIWIVYALNTHLTVGGRLQACLHELRWVRLIIVFDLDTNETLDRCLFARHKVWCLRFQMSFFVVRNTWNRLKRFFKILNYLRFCQDSSDSA
jgi:hypothetical protein